MSGTNGHRMISRRSVLRAAGTLGGLATVGTLPASARGVSGGGDCPEGTIRPDTVGCEGSDTDGCADDHPETKRLQEAVQEVLEERYPHQDALIEQGFIPYFDFMAPDGEEGCSHWLKPEFVGDDAVLDPERPEAVLVDDEHGRSIGVMFVASSDDAAIQRPPAVYDDDDDGRCSPWHAHVGIAGRYAWWKYQLLFTDADPDSLEFPCRTPCMLHVWRYPNPNGVYSHHAPPRGSRGGPVE